MIEDALNDEIVCIYCACLVIRINNRNDLWGEQFIMKVLDRVVDLDACSWESEINKRFYKITNYVNLSQILSN